jgi:DNA-binding transcriptional ArsR family regulator
MRSMHDLQVAFSDKSEKPIRGHGILHQKLRTALCFATGTLNLAVKQNRAEMKSSDIMDQVFFALSDPTRREIIARLARGGASVGELAKPFKISAPAITKHVRTLEQAGIIKREINGRRHECRLTPRLLEQAEDWLSLQRTFWNMPPEQLDRYLKHARQRRKRR